MNWISVKDRLPDKDRIEYLTIYFEAFQHEIFSIGDYDIVPAFFVENRLEKCISSQWISSNEGVTIYPTHWMPLPNPPKGE